MAELIDTKQMELHFEKANMAAEMVERGKGFVLLGAITAGKELIAAKQIAGHGNFTEWLRENWNYSQSLANKYMKIANSERVTNLNEAKSIREALALSMVSEADEPEPPEHAPRSERKTGRVQVSKPELVEPVSNADELDENAVPPEPKTNTKHSKATAKAKEADRPAPMVVTPEIVQEPAGFEVTLLSDFSIAEMIDYLKASADDPKKRARELRKAADELDPPKKFTPPDLEDVRAYCLERRNKVDPEAFHAHYSSNGWRQANGNKLADWKAAIITWEKRNDSGNRGSSGANRVTTGRIQPAPVDESKIRYV